MTDAEAARIHAAAMRVPRPWSLAEIGAIRLMPGAVEATQAGGFALGRVTLDEAELLTIAVDPDHQRQGIGRELLGSFHEALRARGAAHCHLEVAESNAPARALYTAAGYVETGRRRGYYTEAKPPEDAIGMTCPL